MFLLVALVTPGSEAGVVAVAAPPPAAGIGARLKGNAYEGLAIVNLPLPGSPAERAGLRPGDVIVTVDGWSTKEEVIETVVRHVGGAAGTEVVLGVRRDGEPLTIRVRREPVQEIAATQARVEAEMCPALWEAFEDREKAFASVKGAELPDTGDRSTPHAAKTALPTAEYTRVDVGLTTSWTAGFGTYASAVEAARKLDEVVARFRPCLANTWIVREVEDGRPVVRFGLEHPMGWRSSAGAFRARSDGVVDLYIESGAGTLYGALYPESAPAGPWVTPLREITAAAKGDFAALRKGEPHEEGSPFNSWSWYEVSVPLPGARDCRINGGGMFGGTYYQCTLAQNAAPESIGPSFDEAAQVIGRTLGKEWVYWFDTEPAAHERHFIHFAKRTTRGYEKTAVITLGLTETGITLSVEYEGII
ncbi:MAG: PDZ domain-containing protein [Myxococcota bacterium]